MMEWFSYLFFFCFTFSWFFGFPVGIPTVQQDHRSYGSHQTDTEGILDAQESYLKVFYQQVNATKHTVANRASDCQNITLNIWNLYGR